VSIRGPSLKDESKEERPLKYVSIRGTATDVSIRGRLLKDVSIRGTATDVSTRGRLLKDVSIRGRLLIACAHEGAAIAWMLLLASGGC
jgi:hypothetical protein